MSKILFFIDDLGSGGAQRQMVELALGFKEKMFDVSILTYHKRNFYESILLENHIPNICISEKNYVRRVFKIRQHIKSSNYDCVISFLTSANYISIISNLPVKKWKVIVGERSSNPKILESFRSKVFRRLYFFADTIVSNSYANIELLKKVIELSESKTKVIYNIVDSIKWQPDLSYSKNQNDKFILVVPSSHQYLKNLRNLTLGVNLLSENEKNKIRIEWYGDNIEGNYFDNSYPEALELIEKLNLQDQFSFYSATHEIPAIVKNADAVGLFSFYEGLPNAVCEAMFAGKPVIASNVSDIPILINNSSLICDPRNPSSIKEAISYLLSCDTKVLDEIGFENRKNAVLLFDREKIISEYISLIK